MINYSLVNVKISSILTFYPEGIDINTIYSVIKKEELFFIKTGEIEIPVSEFVLQMFFEPQDGITWEDVDFNSII